MTPLTLGGGRSLARLLALPCGGVLRVGLAAGLGGLGSQQSLAVGLRVWLRVDPLQSQVRPCRAVPQVRGAPWGRAGSLASRGEQATF